MQSDYLGGDEKRLDAARTGVVSAMLQIGMGSVFVTWI
jgi:hypothetical protein